MVVFRYILTTLVVVCSLTSNSADLFDTRTAIVNPAFHSLQVKLDGNEMAPPILTLNSDDRLVISFDELAEDRRYMRYELIHCDSRWRRDALVAPEYLDGFNEGQINDYAFSRATTTHYVNYRLELPNEDVKPTLSGNYLLRVFDESEPDNTLLQVRFSIVEPQMTAFATVSSRTDVDYNDGHQQLTIGIDARSVPVNNMYTDILVSVTQNGREDNVAYSGIPSRIAGTTAWFEHDRNFIFPAGNEYRRMEIISTTYPGMNVDGLSYAHPYYHADLLVDLPRCDLEYVYDQTQHGRFKVREYNSDESDIEADYMIVHFALDIPEMRGYDVFIDGDMVQRRFSPDSRMVFNRATGRYENAMLLKQGAYNYQYLAVPYGTMSGTTKQIEGDNYQTTNEYIIKVYYRQPGDRYDRLVAVTSAYSGL